MAGRMSMLTYKVVEVTTVTEDVLENELNEWTAKGWRFEGIQFAMRESSRRPSMAFVIFTKETEK
jgi:NAD(P)H-flavin reductase